MNDRHQQKDTFGVMGRLRRAESRTLRLVQALDTSAPIKETNFTAGQRVRTVNGLIGTVVAWPAYPDHAKAARFTPIVVDGKIQVSWWETRCLEVS